jgi:cardiolipin synthase
MWQTVAYVTGAALCIALSGCTLSRPQYQEIDVRVGDPAFVRAVEAHTVSSLVEGNRASVLLNGDEIFPAMLEAIRGAKTTITFATYLYEEGAIAHEMAAAFAERCRAGVGVNVLVDAVGSRNMPKADRALLRDAGCHLAFYSVPTALTVRRMNRRNHRRILVVDGLIGFTGGTGVGSHWTGDGRGAGRWRQTDVRVEGPIVGAMQAAFAENWRETTGILLTGDAYFPPPKPRGHLVVQSVKSSPTTGAAEAYLLFLLALEGAQRSIRLTTPYFVPDGRMAEAIERAARRGVDVSIITAGEVGYALDRIVRKASQAHFGRALEAGARIYEYRPAWLHAKTIVVDGQWATIGSANLDNRSFALNHELNLAFFDRALAARLDQVFEADLRFTREVTLADWQRRTLRNLLYLPIIPLRDQL